MGGASLLIVTLLVASAFAGQLSCPEDWNEERLMPHQNCARYYKCTYGEPIAQECPPNLFYNPTNWQCDWADNVDCSDRSPPGSVPVVPTPAPEVTEPEESAPVEPAPEAPAHGACHEDALLTHENCNQFYKCSYGVPIAQYCPSGLEYNPIIEQCDWPENVDCGDRSPPGSVPVVPTPAPEVTEPEESAPVEPAPEAPAHGACHEGALLTHENCNQFYKCSYGVPIAQYCPSGLEYNPIIEQCDWPENVDCGDRSPPGSVPVVPTPAPEVTEPEESAPVEPAPEAPAPGACPEGALLTHEKCNQFYKCSYGVPIAQYCPSGLEYNPIIEQCDWPENVDCDDRSPPGSVPDVPAPEESAPEVPEPEEQPAPAPEEPAPEVIAPDCSEWPEEEMLFTHENCNRFYQCAGGEAVAHTCPGGLQFNSLTWQCDYPEYVDCSDRRPPGGAPAQPEEGAPEEVEIEFGSSGCPTDEEMHWLMPHENDCNKFYRCIWGKRLVASCPPHMAFNRDLQVCDHPEDARCVQQQQRSSPSLDKHLEARLRARSSA